MGLPSRKEASRKSGQLALLSWLAGFLVCYFLPLGIKLSPFRGIGSFRIVLYSILAGVLIGFSGSLLSWIWFLKHARGNKKTS
jgi:hypothetical protein